MNYQFQSDMKWSNGENTDHNIALDLDLALLGILQSSHNIQARLSTQEHEIRTEIFKHVAEQIIPQIIDETGIDSHTAGDLHVKSHSKIENEAVLGIPTRNDTSLSIRNSMHILLDLSADQPVNAVQALYANRGGVSADITNEIMKLLKNGVLHVQDHETESSWVLHSDRVQSLKHHVKKSSTDNN